VGIGLGKLVRVGTTVLNFFVEPQFSIAHSGRNQPLVQIYAALNMQFYP
jgi:hypothetical protein